jgi:transposase-like protein
MSDEAGVYKKLRKLGYQHGSVKHGKRHWAKGNINTNSIESFWALFKRTYHGTYHTMTKKHLQRYINEVTFRFNGRESSMQEKFDALTARVSKHGKISYKTLTA